MTAMKPRVLLTLGLLAFAGLLWLGVKTSRAGYEGPDYSVISKEGEVEIRRYETMTAAATPMKIDGKEGGRDSGFGRLFRFITGDNEREENIAMTSPVFIESDVAATEKVMIFVMPEA
ncbi:MAG: heme-binding protein, partial [Verrucomicrobiae bacterium]|nr:heme-binding protein [Verrucomicrobiae bacterium]